MYFQCLPSFRHSFPIKAKVGVHGNTKFLQTADPTLQTPAVALLIILG